MKNSQAITYWEGMARSNPDEKTIKVNPWNDYTDIDARFIMNHSNSRSRILDLACGTGLTTNKYYTEVGHIDAVEMFPEFSQFIVKSPNVDIFNEDISEFEIDELYDLIVMFGIVQYFNEVEISDLYAKYKEYLKPSGKLLIKNQFGVNEDVHVSGISEELGREYLSQYRHVKKEESILRSIGFQAIKVVDIYPPEANRWENTHFFAIIAGTEETV